MNGPDINRNAYLDYVARCHQAFTPFAPIELPDFFAGRAHFIDDIRNELQAPGRQVAIYGERGVGKTSLALLLYFFAGYDEEEVHTYRCHRGSTFDEICASLLAQAGDSVSVDEAQTESGKSGDVRLGPVGGSLTRRTTLTYRPVEDSQAITPSRMVKTFRELRSLLIIDEFDRVEDAQTKTRMAELIKHFSDSRSLTKIVVVGVAETLNELIGEHESLSRSLAQIGLGRMAEPELKDIIQRGSRRVGVVVDHRVMTRVVRLADGFPHFVHLLCLYASLYAGEVLHNDANARPTIRDREYQLGLKSAISKSEHSLQDAYESAIVTTRRKSDIYDLALRAMSLSSGRDVSSSRARQARFIPGW